MLRTSHSSAETACSLLHPGRPAHRRPAQNPRGARPGAPAGRRGFGSAVQAVLRYLGAAAGDAAASSGGSSPAAAQPAHTADGLPSVAASLGYAGAWQRMPGCLLAPLHGCPACMQAVRAAPACQPPPKPPTVSGASNYPHSSPCAFQGGMRNCTCTRLPRVVLDALSGLHAMLRAGARVMAFLAGPPDYARGAVLRRPPARLPSASSGPTMFDPAFPDSNPYASGPLAAVSGRERGRQASAQPDGVPEAIEVCCVE